MGGITRWPPPDRAENTLGFKLGQRRKPDAEVKASVGNAMLTARHPADIPTDHQDDEVTDSVEGPPSGDQATISEELCEKSPQGPGLIVDLQGVCLFDSGLPPDRKHGVGDDSLPNQGTTLPVRPPPGDLS